MISNQIKTKERVRELGEVYTNKTEINDMLNLIGDVTYKIETTFLEPACGNGNFLEEILKRKIINITNIYKKNNNIKIFEFNIIKSISSIYGIDIDKDNVIEARKRLINLIIDLYKNFLNIDLYCQSIYKIIIQIIEKNIIQNNFLNDLNNIQFYNMPNNIPNENSDIIEFITLKNIKLDIIIGNPPYQIKDGGYGASAKPIYQDFIYQAISLNPTYLSMIIPARWYSGGKGLYSFRNFMINESKIKTIVDYSNSKDCFSNVDIKGGICYFLWDSNHNDQCLFINKNINQQDNKMVRKLNQFDPFVIRQNKAIPILNKIISYNLPSLSSEISKRNPFGLRTNFKNYTNEISEKTLKIYGYKKISYIKKDLVPKFHDSFSKWKVLLPYASDGSGNYPIIVLGKPIIAEPLSICTETYLVFSYFDSQKEAEHFSNYLKTKFFRFLISQLKTTQHFSADKAYFVPLMNMNEDWNDDKLYSFFNLSNEEISYIELQIKKMN